MLKKMFLYCVASFVACHNNVGLPPPLHPRHLPSAQIVDKNVAARGVCSRGGRPDHVFLGQVDPGESRNVQLPFVMEDEARP